MKVLKFELFLPLIINYTKLLKIFDETLRYGEDSDCWRRIFLTYKPCVIKPSGVYSFKHNYLSEQSSLSSHVFEMSKSQLISLTKQMLFEVKPMKSKLIYLVAIGFSFVKATITLPLVLLCVQ